MCAFCSQAVSIKIAVLSTQHSCMVGILTCRVALPQVCTWGKTHWFEHACACILIFNKNTTEKYNFMNGKTT